MEAKSTRAWGARLKADKGNDGICDCQGVEEQQQVELGLAAEDGDDSNATECKRGSPMKSSPKLQIHWWQPLAR